MTYYTNNIPYSNNNIYYNQTNDYQNYHAYQNTRRPGPPGPPPRPGRPGPGPNRPFGGFALPFALGFLTSPLLLGPRPRPFYGYYPYYY